MNLRVLLATFALLALALHCGAADTLPYLGEWSNGRGETLVITKATIQFGSDRAVKYRDVTRVSDGESFELEITTPGEINAFPGKTLHITFEEDPMRITSYASHADFMHGGDVQSETTWYRETGADE